MIASTSEPIALMLIEQSSTVAHQSNFLISRADQVLMTHTLLLRTMFPVRKIFLFRSEARQAAPTLTPGLHIQLRMRLTGS